MRICLGLAFCIISISIFDFMFGKVGWEEGYLALSRNLLGIDYVLLLPAFLLVIFGKNKSFLLKLAVGLSAILLIVFSIWWAVTGIASDPEGWACSLFGGTGSCLENSFVWTLAVVFLPSLVPVLLVLFGFTTAGLIDELRRRKTRAPLR